MEKVADRKHGALNLSSLPTALAWIVSVLPVEQIHRYLDQAFSSVDARYGTTSEETAPLPEELGNTNESVRT